MKKLISLIAIISILFFSFSTNVFAYELKDTKVIELTHGIEVKNVSSFDNDIEASLQSLPNEQSSYSYVISSNRGEFETILIDDKSHLITSANHFVKAGETYKFVEKFKMNVSKVDYDLTPTNTDGRNYPQEVLKYLESSEKIESDNPIIVDLNKKILSSLPTSQRENPYYIIKAIYNYIPTHMYYFDDYMENHDHSNKGALYAAKTSVGVCEDYVALFVALARVNKIPARMSMGYILDEINSGENDLKEHGHAWPEVYFEQLGWVPFEITYVSFNYTEIEVDRVDGMGKELIRVHKPLSRLSDQGFGRLEGYYILTAYDVDSVYYVKGYDFEFNIKVFYEPVKLTKMDNYTVKLHTLNDVYKSNFPMTNYKYIPKLLDY